jgi:hypothetical protein
VSANASRFLGCRVIWISSRRQAAELHEAGHQQCGRQYIAGFQSSASGAAIPRALPPCAGSGRFKRRHLRHGGRTCLSRGP